MGTKFIGGFVSFIYNKQDLNLLKNENYIDGEKCTYSEPASSDKAIFGFLREISAEKYETKYISYKPVKIDNLKYILFIDQNLKVYIFKYNKGEFELVQLLPI